MSKINFERYNKLIMTFELSYLWQFYTAVTGHDDEEFLDLDPFENLDDESRRIINQLDCFAPGTSKISIKKYIRFQQRGMVRFIKLIEGHLLQTEKFSPYKLEILKKLLQLTEGLLGHILFFHDKEFNYKEGISTSRREKLKSQAKVLQEELKQQFVNHHSNSDSEFEILSVLFESIDVASFEELLIHENLFEHLKERISVINTEAELMRELLKTGYSSPRFVDYHNAKILIQLKEEKGLAEKYKFILSLIKQIEQSSLHEIILSRKQAKKLKKQRLKFLKEELKFIKKLDFVTSELINTGLLDANYKVSLSVKQLAYYVSLNVEAGIITERKAKKVHEYIVSHVTTSEKEDIAEKSFKNAYYVHAPNDIRKIIEKLGRMLALAQSQL